MLVKVFGGAVYGVDAEMITTEVNVGGSFGFVLVGLPDNAVKESKERTYTAIKNMGLNYPKGKVTINMAPADIKKEGSNFDLPIALGILSADGQIEPAAVEEYLMAGELSLDGGLRPVRGALPMAILARKQGFKGIMLPAQNASEAAIVDGIDVIPLTNLKEAVQFLNGANNIEPVKKDTRELFFKAQDLPGMDFCDVKGQITGKRALEVAAAGGHNILMVGPPGAGKTMLARRLPTILPPLSLQEALETTKIHSVAGKLGTNASLVAHRPFRSPHHTISDVALVGGGSHPHPGEISLAHNGVLFLDELPEFKRSALEVLRQPLEERRVTVARARFTVDFPANFMLVASLNPCPCGLYNHPDKACICSPQQRQKYMARISGPLLDRIDIQKEVTPVNFDDLSSTKKAEKSAEIRERVVKARMIQQERYQPWPGIHCNAMVPPGMVRRVCRIDDKGRHYMQMAMDKLGLSARAYDRILKVSRTIADLHNEEKIRADFVAEAIQYRNLDRESWGL